MNKTYFKYLLKSKRNLISFVVIFEIMICMITRFTGNNHNPLATAILFPFIYSLGLCYILPAYLLRLFHIKQMEDLYLSLPYSRKEQMANILLFMLLVILVPLLVLSIIFGGLCGAALNTIGLILVGEIISILAVLLVNCNIYLTANSILDGIVMMLAYSVLPLVAMLFSNSFEQAFVAGYQPITEKLGWTSVIYQAVVLMVSLVNNENSTSLASPIVMMLVLVLISLVLGYLLFFNIKKRKAERAQERSSEWLAYPLIIHIYAFLCLGAIVFNGMEYGFDVYVILYVVIIFIAFCIAHFVYRREIRIDIKSLAFFAVSIVLAYGLGTAAFATRGFGLADGYNKDIENAHFDWSFDCAEQVEDYLGKKVDVEYSWIYADVVIEKEEMQKHPELAQLILDIQKQCVDIFYSGAIGDSNTNGSVSIYENCTELSDYWKSKYSYSYNGAVELNEEILTVLSKYGTVSLYYEDQNYNYYSYDFIDGKWVKETEE